MTRREVRLSPSSINYEDRRCDRCMGESYNGERWPDGPFPGIFAKLDSQQRRYFTGRSTADIDSALASGVIENGGRVESAPISVDSPVPEHVSQKRATIEVRCRTTRGARP